MPARGVDRSGSPSKKAEAAPSGDAQQVARRARRAGNRAASTVAKAVSRTARKVAEAVSSTAQKVAQAARDVAQRVAGTSTAAPVEAVVKEAGPAKKAGKKATKGAAKKVGKKATKGGARKVGKKATPGGAKKVAKTVTPGGAKKATPGGARKAAKKAAPGGAKKATPGGAKKAAKKATPGGARKAAKKATPGGAKEVGKKATPGGAKEAAPNAARKAAKQAVPEGGAKTGGAKKGAAKTGGAKKGAAKTGGAKKGGAKKGGAKEAAPGSAGSSSTAPLSDWLARLNTSIASLQADPRIDVVVNWRAPGATAAQLDAVEAKLGVKLEPAIRSLYSQANGLALVWGPKGECAKPVRGRPTMMDMEGLGGARGAIYMPPIGEVFGVRERPFFDYAQFLPGEPPHWGFDFPGNFYTPAFVRVGDGLHVRVGDDHGAAWDGPSVSFERYLENVLATWGSIDERAKHFIHGKGKPVAAQPLAKLLK